MLALPVLWARKRSKPQARLSSIARTPTARRTGTVVVVVRIISDQVNRGLHSAASRREQKHYGGKVMLVSLVNPWRLHDKRDLETWLASTGEPSTSPCGESKRSGASGEPAYVVRRCDCATDVGARGSEVGFHERCVTRCLSTEKDWTLQQRADPASRRLHLSSLASCCGSNCDTICLNLWVEE